MVRRIREYLEYVTHDELAGKRLFLITLITALFILALAVQNDRPQEKYVIDSNGNVTGIQSHGNATSDTYDLKLSLIDGGEVTERSVRINKQAVKDVNSEQSNNRENRTEEREAEITRIITEIELSPEKTISLPVSLSDGTRLKWSLNRREDSSFILLPVVYLCLVFLVIKSSIDARSDINRKKRQDILMGLPRFSNQLLLMMNAGMILSDAVEEICRGYEYSENKGYFENELMRIVSQNRDHRDSTANVLNEFARETNVKELMRISTILTENERRGSDVIESLGRESRYLWDDRIIMARERGRMIDTRMSYPMAILLMLLMTVTMAPALLNM